jgi:crossover junction endodeoxyribonuclease RusA
MSDERLVLRFVVVGPVRPKQRPRLGRGGKVYTPEATKKYEAHVGTIARSALSHLRGWRHDWAAFGVTLRMFRGSERYDIDNSCKSLLDAMNGVVWVDDDAVTELCARVVSDPSRPRVEIEVRMLGDEPRKPAKPRKRAPRQKQAPGVLRVPSVAALLGVGRVKRRRKRR